MLRVAGLAETRILCLPGTKIVVPGQLIFCNIPT